MSIVYKFVAFLALATAAAVPAAAQNINGDATYGSVTLNSGYTPDPYRVNLLSGGRIDAANIGSPCRGFIANAPDFRLFYSNGRLPLIISVDSAADTTLVVNAPDGRWYCDDDGGNGLNPSVRFNQPMSGRYEIWVGTYGRASNERAELNISELYSQ